MAAQDKQRIFNVKGRFVKGATDPSAAFPHGGTALGYASSVSYRPVVNYDMIIGEEKGESAVEIIETEGTGTLSFTMRQWDNDTLDEVFPNTVTATDEEIVESPGSYQRLLASTGIVLLFSPDDPRMPGIICYRAVPAIEETAALNFNLSSELGVGCVFYLLEGSNGKAVQVVKLARMTAPP